MAIDTDQKSFARLVATHQREVQGYIFANVPRWADADEIWQETCVRLWEEFEKYEPGTNFAGWAVRVAYYQILTWRKNVSRSRLLFDQEFIDALATEQAMFSSEESRERLNALDECLQELSDRKREVLARFSTHNMRAKEVAQVMKCSTESVYKMVQRVRWALRQCIERRTESGDLA